MKANLKFNGDEVFSEAEQIASGTWTGFLAITIAQRLVLLFFIIPILTYIAGVHFKYITNFLALGQGGHSLDMDSMLASFTAGAISFSPRIFIGILLVLLISLYIGSWAYNAMFNIAGNHISGKEAPLLETIRGANDKRIFRLIGGVLLLILISIGVSIGSSFLSFLFLMMTRSILFKLLLGVGLFFFNLMVICRYILIFPAIAIGGDKVIDALAFSTRKISWQKSIRYALITFAFVFVGGLALIFIQMIIGFVLPASILSVFISQVVFLIIGAYVLAYIIGGMTALYYREAGFYADEDEEDADDLFYSDNLV